MLPSIHQRYTDNLLLGATVDASPAPLTSYSATTLLTLSPAARVRWAAAAEIRIRFELPTAQRADVLVIPVWNVDGGSPSVARLESDAGLDVAIPVPAMMPSGIPRTTALDLTLAEPNATLRTSDAFDLVITGNSVPLTMGGAVVLYGPKRTFTDRDWHWSYTRAQHGHAIVHVNDYGTDLVYTRRTRTRTLAVETRATDAEALDLELWADANFGHGLPGLIWPIPDEQEAFLGRLDPEQAQQTTYTDAIDVSLTFTELSKGKPVV